MSFVKKAFLHSIITLLIIVTFIPAGLALAQGFDGPGIGSGGGFVPCGNDLTQGECNFCHLIELIRRVFRFLIYLAAPVVTVLIAWAGIRLMVNADNEGEREKAKTLLKDALIGFLIMILAGFFVSLILGLLVKTEQRGPNWWWGGDLKCETVIPNTSVNYLYVDGTNQGVGVVKSGAIDLSAPMGQESILAGIRKVSQYDSLINAASEKYGIPADRIKAIITVESGGNASAVGRAGEIGLMQTKLSTAKYVDKTYFGGKYFFGLSDTEIQNKLTDPRISIELGTQYYSEALKKTGESDYSKASAYYNGGPEAVAPSREKSCVGQMIWECTLNSGYAVTRNYVRNLNAVQAAINK